MDGANSKIGKLSLDPEKSRIFLRAMPLTRLWTFSKIGKFDLTSEIHSCILDPCLSVDTQCWSHKSTLGCCIKEGCMNVFQYRHPSAGEAYSWLIPWVLQLGLLVESSFQLADTTAGYREWILFAVHSPFLSVFVCTQIISGETRCSFCS